MAKKPSNKTTKRSNQIKLIRKSNKLVEARYKFDIWEMRVFIKMVSMIKPDDRDFTQYKISVTDIINDFNLHNSGNYYSSLREGAEKLLTKQVEMEKLDDEGKKKKITLNLISSTESYVDENDGKDIILKFDPELKRHLLDLKEQYLTYDVRNILKLTSVHSIRIYELLKQYEGLIGGKGYVKRKFTIAELKDTLGIGQNEYSLYGHFKNKVLLKAQKDLFNETDIRFELEEEKLSRKVVSVSFLIYINDKKKTRETDHAEQVNPSDHPQFNAIYIKVKEFVNKDVVEQWFNELTFNQISAGVSYTLNQHSEGKVNDVAKYLQKMVRTKTLFDELQGKSAKEEEVKRRKDYRKQQDLIEKQKEEAEKNFKREFTAKRKEIMLSVLNRKPQAYKFILESLKKEVEEGTKNFFSVMAYERYQKAIENKKETLQEFINIIESDGAIFGYVSNKTSEMYFDDFSTLVEDYKVIAKNNGFSQSSIF